MSAAKCRPAPPSLTSTVNSNQYLNIYQYWRLDGLTNTSDTVHHADHVAKGHEEPKFDAICGMVENTSGEKQSDEDR